MLRKKRDPARTQTWALWLPVRCSYDWATGVLSFEQKIRCTIIHRHSSIRQCQNSNTSVLRESDQQSKGPGSSPGWISFLFYTVIVHRTDHLQIISHLHLRNHLLNSEAKMQAQGRLVNCLQTFVAALAFKVLQLAKNVHLTVANAVDILSRQESK